jgi:predicted phosphodiesterase
VRIALIGDSHGHLPALEAVLKAARDAGPDLIVHIGDVLTAPFSPDPVEDSIALLKAEGVVTICGNHDLVMRSPGTPEWQRAIDLRVAARGGPPGPWVRYVPIGQARMTPETIAWVRALPDDLRVDVARPGDVYVSHSLPGNPFATITGSDPRETFTDEMREAAFARPDPAEADLILCGHSHSPKTLFRNRADGQQQIVVRTGATIGWDVQPGSAERPAGYAIVTRFPDGWRGELKATTWRPTDPTWHWRREIDRLEAAER